MTQSVANARTWQGITIPAPGTFNLDPSHSTVGFVATHMMFTKVRGRFTDVEGVIELADDPTESVVNVTIKTASVDTASADRDNHLRAGDFFDSETYPEMTFRSTSVEHVSGNDFVVTGDLTIRGVTRPVDLKVTFEGVGTNPWGVEVAGVSARAEINREDWSLTWNAALETGGVLVGKKVVLEIEVQAARA